MLIYITFSLICFLEKRRKVKRNGEIEMKGTTYTQGQSERNHERKKKRRKEKRKKRRKERI